MEYICFGILFLKTRISFSKFYVAIYEIRVPVKWNPWLSHFGIIHLNSTLVCWPQFPANIFLGNESVWKWASRTWVEARSTGVRYWANKKSSKWARSQQTPLSRWIIIIPPRGVERVNLELYTPSSTTEPTMSTISCLNDYEWMSERPHAGKFGKEISLQYLWISKNNTGM